MARQLLVSPPNEFPSMETVLDMAGQVYQNSRARKVPNQVGDSNASPTVPVQSVEAHWITGSSRKQPASIERAFAYYARLQSLKVYVESNPAEHISLQTAAKVAHLEKKYFSAYFHRKIGIPFSHWLARVRIEKALQAISDTDESLTQIAASVGFKSLRSFERSFKRIAGVSPFEFKKSVKPCPDRKSTITKTVALITNLVAKI